MPNKRSKRGMRRPAQRVGQNLWHNVYATVTLALGIISINFTPAELKIEVNRPFKWLRASAQIAQDAVGPGAIAQIFDSSSNDGTCSSVQKLVTYGNITNIQLRAPRMNDYTTEASSANVVGLFIRSPDVTSTTTYTIRMRVLVAYKNDLITTETPSTLIESSHGFFTIGTSYPNANSS